MFFPGFCSESGIVIDFISVQPAKAGHLILESLCGGDRHFLDCGKIGRQIRRLVLMLEGTIR